MQPAPAAASVPPTIAGDACSDPAKGSHKADAPSKRRKVSEIDIEQAKAKVIAAKAARTLTKLSIPELKVYLKSIGKPVGGKKGELIERIQCSPEL